VPIYEYRCTSCGFEKEYLQKVSDPPVTQCPNCGQTAMIKKLTVAGFQLKGTGWYATDFKHGSTARPAPSGKGNGAEGGSGKSDDKPAASDSGGDKGSDSKASDAKSSEAKSSDSRSSDAKASGGAAAKTDTSSGPGKSGT